MKASSAVLFVLGLVMSLSPSSTARAAVVAQVIPQRDPSSGIPFTMPEAALGSPWVSYLIRLESTAGEKIAAVDFKLSGQLHQGWFDNDDDGSFSPTPNSANTFNGDSHLLAPASALFAISPTEDNSGTGSPLVDTSVRDYGLGTMLRGAWGITGAEQTTSANLAYIVIPHGTEIDTSVEVQAADRDGNIVVDLSGALGRQIEVFGLGGNQILDGDQTPNSDDGTDLGALHFLDNRQRTFNISNPGISRLNLAQPVITGQFSLVGNFPAFVEPGQTASFTVALNSLLPRGEYFGSVAFAHDVDSSGTFNFDLRARLVPEPACLSLSGLAAVVATMFSRRRVIRI